MSDLPSSAPVSLCVFCGARPGRDPAHQATAAEVGRMIARRGMRLVYGAGDSGLMGATAAAARAAGADTLGVIPAHLMGRERTGANGDRARLIVTETMHERKKVMFMNADALVTLPGGAGSLDEFFEMLTWRQLGLHDKPLFLLNAGGFWSPLIALVDHVITEGFAGAELRDYFTVVADVPELESALCRRFPACQPAQE